MNSKDKTRQKLVGSMRKTKDVAGIGSNNIEAGSVSAASEPSKPAKPATNRANAGASSSRSKSIGANGYQSGRRVWPD
jgi:hypothetical protein